MGCVVSTAIAVLLCKNKCSVDRLVSKMAFHPPSPPSYTLEEAADGTYQLQFASREMTEALRIYERCPVKCTIRMVRTKRRQSVVLFHFVNPQADKTLLWSHSNAMDAGEMYFFFIEVAMRLGVSVAAYDYSGYGQSTGTPSEANICADALAVYHHLTTDCGIDPHSSLVVYGQSIGSVATLYLASRKAVAGIVLHSPLLSGLRFLIPPSTGFCSPGGCCSVRSLLAARAHVPYTVAVLRPYYPAVPLLSFLCAPAPLPVYARESPSHRA